MKYPNLSEEEFKTLFEILESVATDSEPRDQEWEGFIIGSYTFRKAEEFFEILKKRGII